MLSILNALKGQLTVLNAIVGLLILAFVFYRYKKTTTARWLAAMAVLIYLVCATAYLPNYLADQLERKYSPFKLSSITSDTTKTLVLVLGSGYTLDKRLPANAQIGLCALGRLTEGIRIHRLIKNSVIICSGNSPEGLETQAQVTKRAAIIMGVNANELQTLDKPSTTQEEVTELGRLYNKKQPLVMVTDAIHMPRAIRLFRKEGFNPVPAPTNYKVNEGPQQEGMQWWPSMGNIGLMNYVVHEWLGNLKAAL